jgi:hypothetical protein
MVRLRSNGTVDTSFGNLLAGACPINAPTGGGIAWNSLGMILKRSDDNTSTLPTEPVKTGIAVKPPDPPY